MSVEITRRRVHVSDLQVDLRGVDAATARRVAARLPEAVAEAYGQNHTPEYGALSAPHDAEALTRRLAGEIAGRLRAKMGGG